MLFEILEIGIPGKKLDSRPPNLGLFMMSFQVDDVEAMIAKCRQQGFEIISSPVVLKAGLQGEVRAATVIDPSGIMVELFER